MKKISPRDPEERIEFWGNLPFIGMHIGCLLVFQVGVSKTALIVFFVSLIPRMFGLTAGYHRYFSHRSFKTSRAFQFFLALLGSCAFQKDPMWWAAHHRLHHKNADTAADAHSPARLGFFRAHMGWVMVKKNANLRPHEIVPDLAKYPELCYLHEHQKVPAFIMLGILAVTGYWLEHFVPGADTTMAQVIVWGFFVSTIFLHHVTFLVNSAAHMTGSRRFKTRDESRNNVWVALLTMGEGWHNNHHRYPSSERQGFYAWEIDMTHYILVVLSWLGLVWDLRRPPKEIYEEARSGSVRPAF